MTREELREKVAKAMAATHGYTPDALTYREADAVIALVLEEAARVAEAEPESNGAMYYTEELRCCALCTGHEIAAAIRALKEKH